jgi:DNA-directed RNA polymerase subunit M/transcription elongation factor TFIIS
MLITARLNAPSEPLHPSRPKCPRCGSALLVAEQSRLSSSGRIEHDWMCDDCGNAFRTSIQLGRNLGPSSQARAADHKPTT